MMPSTCNCVLSLVMQTWLGTSSGTSLSECLYATRSTNGTTKLSPGVSVRSYLPSRSTTHACCCGTILSVCTMKTMATMATTSATSIKAPLDYFLICGSALRGGLEHEPVAFDRADDVFARLRCKSRCEACCPHRATMLDARGAVVGPGLNVHTVADVEVHVAVFGRVPRGRLPRATPMPQHRRATADEREGHD